jgi:hypothetical protein
LVSSDGINWTRISNDQFPGRYGQKGALYNNKMWVVCGTSESALSDVYSSSDGITWTKCLDIKKTWYHCLFSVGDCIYIVGGNYNGISRINFNYSPPTVATNYGSIIF